jgi:hypothetical protein
VSDRPEHPLGADARTVDYVGLAFRALAGGIAVGIGVSALTTFAVRTLQEPSTPQSAIDLSSPPAMVLLGGTLAALVAAAAFTWHRLAPIRSPYRQGMLGAVAAFGSLVLSFIVLRIIEGMFGSAALGIAAALAFLIAWRTTRPPNGTAPQGQQE